MQTLLDLEKHIRTLKEAAEADKIAAIERRKAEADMLDHSSDIRCPKCSSWIASDSHFCEVCGCPINSAAPAVPDAADVPTGSTADASAPEQ